MLQQPAEKNVTQARLSGSWTTYLGAVHGVLTSSGLSDLAIHEMAGITGMAFQFIMHEHCDAASVTVYDWVNRHQDALDRIGILSEIYHYEPGSQTYEASRKRAVVNIKKSIDQGIGVIAWAIDTGEFGVIYGYDDHDGVFLVDGVNRFNHVLGSDPMLFENVAKKFPAAPFLHYQIAVESVDFKLEEAYRNSLKFYIGEMEKEYHMAPSFKSGFLAYNNWISALKNNSCNPFGLRYCTAVYAESKCFAAQYMKHLENEWGGIPNLGDIAAQFDQVSDLYQTMMKVLEQDWNGGKHLGKPVTQEQIQQMIPLVLKAKELESQVVRIMKSALKL